MSDNNQSQANNPVFNIEKIYLKDVSLEVPNAPQIFLEREAPEMDMDIQTRVDRVEDAIYDVHLTITVTAKRGDKVFFLIEAKQAGIFRIEGLPEEALEPTLAVACPNILFPYAREAVSDVSVRAGFPPVVLQPVNFEALYMQQKQAQASGQPN
ncbi:MAG: protein-export chaperone SecB [Betaproteobacteria bacterium]|nr:protein-export chaperone SecB [Betaproteobacteria bacterium]